MPKLFVFGIGGTGSRVLKSLTMLLASGLKAGKFDVVPILVDPHKDLKELNDCKSLLKLYQKLHVKIYESADGLLDGFFKNPMPTFNSLSDDFGLKDDFDFDERHDCSFSQFLELSSLPQDDKTKDLLSLLYSDENLSRPLSLGFKGNPNVGSVVLNKLEGSAGFIEFENSFGPDDRIFIISSIFGGTGAAGFPLLLRNFRSSMKPTISESQIGALTVMPYFRLSEPTVLVDDETKEQTFSSDIDSENFLSKTKAALTYYMRPEFSKLYNALYYIGDPEPRDKPYENNEKDQANKAHFIELLGALSVINFANKNHPSTGEVYEYCLKADNVTDINFDNMADETRAIMGMNFTALSILSKLHSSVKMTKGLPFNKIAFNRIFEKDKIFIDNLEMFFNNYYLKWMKELSENDRRWLPLTITDNNDLGSLVIGSFIRNNKYNLFNPKFSLSQVHLEMAKTCEIKTMKDLEKTNGIGLYLAVCHAAITKVIGEKIQF